MIGIAKVYTVVRFVQLRTISCEHCSHPFTYLLSDRCAGEDIDASVLGVSFVSEARARRDLEKNLDAAAKQDQRGFARCPHCSRYQAWMRRNARLAALVKGAVLSLALGAALAVIALIWGETGLRSVRMGYPPQTFFLLGVLLSVPSAWVCAQLGTPSDRRLGKGDPVGLKLEVFKALQHHAREYAIDPALVWDRREHGTSEEPTVVLPAYAAGDAFSRTSSRG